MHYSKVIQELFIIDCYQSVTLCCISARLSLLMCTQRNNTANREGKRKNLLSMRWDSKNIHLIVPIKLVNITTQNGLHLLYLYNAIISMERQLIALRRGITNFIPLSCLWIKAATCDMNARTWRSDYFNNT